MASRFCDIAAGPYGRLVAAPAQIALFSLHQRDAELDAREGFAGALAGAAGSDVLILLTCHRAEVLLAGPCDHEAIAARLGTQLPSGGRLRTGRDAVLQVLRVACGLDSAIRGESQILGQLRRAFDASRARAALDPTLSIVVRRALELGKDLRRTTPLGSIRRTLGSLAVDAALAGAPDTRTATVLVVGAGEVGTLALRSLAPRAGTVLLVNRDGARAAALAAEHGATAVPLEGIDAALARATAVISAADSRGAVLTAERLRARLEAGPLTIVDLAVPRSVAAEARELGGLRYLDVDSLAATGDELDEATVAMLEARCAAAADAIIQDVRARGAARAITALRDHAESIREVHLRRALARLGHLPERDRRIVEGLTEALAHALIHEPTVRLREAPEREASARELFPL
jgi:glutamyl-tRNA reductase